MHQTKIGFDNHKFDELYENKRAEKVWLDFGKGTSTVISHNPLKNSNIMFNGHKMYFMLPP
jgi:hypothetical protein